MTATLSAASVTRSAKALTGRRWTSWTNDAGAVRTSMRVEPGDTMDHVRYLAGVVVEALTVNGGFHATADEHGVIVVAERCEVCHEPRSTNDHGLCDRAAGQYRAEQRSVVAREELLDLATDPTVTPEQVSAAARGERPMPAAYAEPRKGTNAHTAWSRGFTFAEWRALPRSERMAETLRADGKVVTDEQLANLRRLDTPAGALAALRAVR